MSDYDDARAQLGALLGTTPTISLSMPVSERLQQWYGRASSRAIDFAFVWPANNNLWRFHLLCSAEGDSYGALTERGAVGFALSSFVVSEGGGYGAAAVEEIADEGSISHALDAFERKYGKDFRRTAFSGAPRLLQCTPHFFVSVTRADPAGGWRERAIDLTAGRLLWNRTKG